MVPMQCGIYTMEHYAAIKRCVYIYNGILLSYENHGMMPLAATWMDLEIILG